MKVLHIFLLEFQNGRHSQPTVVSLMLLVHDLLSEIQNATGEYEGRRMPGTEYNLYEVRE